MSSRGGNISHNGLAGRWSDGQIWRFWDFPAWCEKPTEVFIRQPNFYETTNVCKQYPKLCDSNLSLRTFLGDSKIRKARFSFDNAVLSHNLTWVNLLSSKTDTKLLPEICGWTSGDQAPGTGRIPGGKYKFRSAVSWVATILFCILDTRIVASYQVCTWGSHQSGRRSGPSWSAWRSGPSQMWGWSWSSASLPKLLSLFFMKQNIMVSSYKASLRT